MQRYADQYQHNQIMTASPAQLLLLTYKGVLRFLREAAEAMRKKDLYAQNEAVVKAQTLLNYLSSTLNHQADPQLARDLARIYVYLVRRLTEANIHDDPRALQEVTTLVSELLAAWEDAAAQTRGGPSASMAANHHLEPLASAVGVAP